ncbi:MAG: hypothetical protein ACRDTC_24365 [Pseudonocardiaceae bacterium]
MRSGVACATDDQLGAGRDAPRSVSRARLVTLARFGGPLLVQPRFDAAVGLELIATHRPHLVFEVPEMFQKLLAGPPLGGTDTSSLHAVVAGGSRVDPADESI